MKDDTLLLVGATAAVYYFLIYKPQKAAAQASDAAAGIRALNPYDTSTITNWGKDILDWVSKLFNPQATTTAGTPSAASNYTRNPATPYIIGTMTPAQTAEFSSLFNQKVAGTIATVSNTAGTAVNLAPNILSQGVSSGAYQGTQAQLTNAAIASGVGVASLAPWAGGGIATNYAALAPKSSAQSTVGTANPAATTQATASLASLYATGRI